MMRSPHEERLRELLVSVSAKGRAVFAATCATRIARAATRDSVDPAQHALRNAIDEIWNQFERPMARGIERPLLELQSLLSVDDESDAHEEHLRMQDAIATSIYALRQLASAGVDDAMHAARQLIDALDRNAQRRLGPGVLGAGEEVALRSDESVAAEEARQLRDARTLRSESIGGDTVDGWRRMAEGEGDRFLLGGGS